LGDGKGIWPVKNWLLVGIVDVLDWSAGRASPSLHFSGHFSRWTWVIWYQNVSILDFIRAKDDGGGCDKWSYKTCTVTVKLSPPTNQHPALTSWMLFLLPNPQCQSTEGKGSKRL